MGWLQNILGTRRRSSEERSADSLNKKAIGLIGRNQLDAAEELLTEVLRTSPDHAAAHHNLGALYLTQKRFPLALKHMRRAARLEPEDIETQIAIAKIYGDMGKKDESLAEYLRICEKSPDDWRSHISLGNALLERGRIDEAVGHLERAVQLDKKEQLTHLMLATAYERKGDLEQAIREYRAVRNVTRIGQNRSAASRKMKELQLRQVQQRAASSEQ